MKNESIYLQAMRLLHEHEAALEDAKTRFAVARARVVETRGEEAAVAVEADPNAWGRANASDGIVDYMYLSRDAITACNSRLEAARNLAEAARKYMQVVLG